MGKDEIFQPPRNIYYSIIRILITFDIFIQNVVKLMLIVASYYKYRRSLSR